MDARVIPLHANFQLNTRLMLNCLEDVTDEMARTRPGADSNSIAFVALHLHDARHYLAKYVGDVEPDPFQQITAAGRGIDDIDIYPSLGEMRTAWMEISLALEQRFTHLTAAVIDRPSPAEAPEFPVQDSSVLGGIAFLLQHEAYHIGQMAFLRKFHGLPAMSWHP